MSQGVVGSSPTVSTSGGVTLAESLYAVRQSVCRHGVMMPIGMLHETIQSLTSHHLRQISQIGKDICFRNRVLKVRVLYLALSGIKLSSKL